MTNANSDDSPAFFNILPIVTGEGEELFIDSFLRSLMDTGKCCFVKARRVGQLTPRTAQRRLQMIQSGKLLTNRQEELGLIARRFLSGGEDRLVILVDDLEAREPQLQDVFDMYRTALNSMLDSLGFSDRASVQFMVRMVEAYYFNDVHSINEVLDLDIQDEDDDPELLTHPKAKLKQLCNAAGRSFDEKCDGFAIAKRLDLPKVLSNPSTCKSLRSLFKWCSRRIDDVDSERFQLVAGIVCEVTGSQIPEAS